MSVRERAHNELGGSSVVTDAHSCLTFLRWTEDVLLLPVLVCLISTHTHTHICSEATSAKTKVTKKKNQKCKLSVLT